MSVPRRHPDWIKVRAPGGESYAATKQVVQQLALHTVCEEAHCPNIAECWGHRTATFMLLGDVCTRNCGYCAVAHGRPLPVDPLEPRRVAEGVARLGLRHVVVTSVDRDDLPDGGAGHFARVIEAIHRRTPGTAVEVLTPDFRGVADALDVVLAAAPEAIEPGLRLVRREYPTAIGPVDLMCRDSEAVAVAVEVKRRGEIDGVEQLTRYLELLNRDPLLAPVRGVFAAQEIKPQARVLAEDRGIRCVTLDYDTMRGISDACLRLF